MYIEVCFSFGARVGMMFFLFLTSTTNEFVQLPYYRERLYAPSLVELSPNPPLCGSGSVQCLIPRSVTRGSRRFGSCSEGRMARGCSSVSFTRLL